MVNSDAEVKPTAEGEKSMRVIFPVYILCKCVADKTVFVRVVFQKDKTSVVPIFTEKPSANAFEEYLKLNSANTNLKVIAIDNLDEFAAYFKASEEPIDYFVVNWTGKSGNFYLIRYDDITTAFATPAVSLVSQKKHNGGV